MANKDCGAEEHSSAPHKTKHDHAGALEIDRKRRTGKLNTGKVRPGQLLEVNQKPIHSDSEEESGVKPPHSKNGEENIQ